MSDKAIKTSASRDPSQKPPSSLESVFNTEKNDATIVGIGRQLDTMYTATSGAISTSSNDVNDDNNRTLATTEPHTTNPTRKRPAVDPKVNRGPSNSNGVINLCSDDNDNTEEEEEKEEEWRLVEIKDRTKSSSQSTSPPSPSTSPTERPKKRTDSKRTPTKHDNRTSTTKTAKSSDRSISNAVRLSQRDEAKSTGMRQSTLSFSKNGCLSAVKINSRASTILQPISDNNRNKKCSTRSNLIENSNNKAGINNNNNNNQSNTEGDTKLNPKSKSLESKSKYDPRCCTCPAGSHCKEDCSCKKVGLLCSSCEEFDCGCTNAFHRKELMRPLPWNASTSTPSPSSSTIPLTNDKKKDSTLPTATSKILSKNNNNNNNTKGINTIKNKDNKNDGSNKINLKHPPPAAVKVSNPYQNKKKNKKKNNAGKSNPNTNQNPNSSPFSDSDDDDTDSSNITISRRLKFGTGDLAPNPPSNTNTIATAATAATATTTATAATATTATTTTTTTTTNNNTTGDNLASNINNNNNNNSGSNNSNTNNINNTDGNGSNNRPPPRVYTVDPRSDLPGAEISAANKMLDEVYGDHVHDNPGSHLSGLISSSQDQLWQGYFRRLIPHNQSLYDCPKGKLGKDITNEYSNLFEDIMKGKCNMEKLLVFPVVVLQRRHGVTKNADVKRRLLSRLTAWKEGKYKYLVEDTHRDLIAKQSKARGDTTPAHRAKVYSSKLMRGHLSSAVNYITDREGGGILYPYDVDEKSGHTVSRVLQDKHPSMRDPGPTAMPAYESVPELPTLEITADTVEIVAGKLSGGAGLSGVDSIQLKHLLLHHGQASQRLRNVCAKFGRWLANEHPPWASYRAMLANRLIALDKMPGIRPVGIGDTWRRFFAKLVLAVSMSYATDCCGSDQLCAGLRAGVDGAIHGLSAIWREMESEENTGFVLIDADNAFNEVSRINMLWTIRHEWPAGARFAFNCYRHHSLLVVRNPGGKPFTFFSKEGVTQGDPFAMIAYGVALLPLIRKLKELNVLLVQSWYADDASAAGKFDEILRLFQDLLRMGPDFGYFPNASKSILITHPDNVVAAHHFFNETHGLGFKISTGSRFLGGFIGDTTSRDEYVSTKIADWIHGTKELAAVARLKYPHAAYTGITKCLQHKWSFTQRVIPGIDDLFQPLEDELTNNFLPALFGDPPSTMDDKLRLLTALPVKHAGLALPNPVTSSATNYKNSTLMSSHLLLAVQGKINFSLQDHRDTCQSSLSASRELRQTENDSSLTNLLAALPPAAAGQASTTRAIKRACETGLWLTTIPNHINGNILGCDEFIDATRLRYQKVPHNLPAKCDGCGSAFDVGHALQCKSGGLIIRRHDELNLELASLAKMALKESAIRAEPEINPSASIMDSPTTITAIDTNGDRGDLLIKGFWDNGMDAIIDVRITDTDAKSYRTRDPKKILQSQEKEKKKKYLDQCLLQRRAFTPFVVSVDGLIGYEASNVLKQLSKRLADKWNKPYSVTCGIVRSRISIACARASNQCLRGSRIPFKTMSRQIQWEDGAGAGLYRIVR